MKKNKLLIAIGVAVLVGIVSFLAYKAQNSSESDNVIRVGAILPLTGYGAYNGAIVKNGLELSMRNHENLDVRFEDSKTTPKEAINAFKRLESLGVKYFIVQGGPLAMAVAPFTRGKDMLLFGLATTEEQFVKITDRAIRVSPSVEKMSRTIAAYDYNELGKRSAAIVYIEQEYGQSSRSAFKRQFESLGGHIVLDESYAPTQRDFHDVISKIKQAKPDVIHLVGVGDGLSTFVRQCFEDDFVKNIQITGDMTFALPNIKQNIGNIVKDIFYVDGVASSDFLQIYNDAFSVEGCSYPAYAYIIPSLIIGSGSCPKDFTTDSVMKYIKENEHDTELGRMSFNNTGDADVLLRIIRISNAGYNVVQ